MLRPNFILFFFYRLLLVKQHFGVYIGLYRITDDQRVLYWPWDSQQIQATIIHKKKIIVQQQNVSMCWAAHRVSSSIQDEEGIIDWMGERRAQRFSRNDKSQQQHKTKKTRKIYKTSKKKKKQNKRLVALYFLPMAYRQDINNNNNTKPSISFAPLFFGCPTHQESCFFANIYRKTMSVQSRKHLFQQSDDNITRCC